MSSDNVAVKNVYQLNPEIYTSKKICIFGTGVNAVHTFAKLAEENIYVDFFADRSPQCEKVKVLLNRPVLHEDELAGMECSIIIASVFWREIANRLQKKNISRLFVAPTVLDRSNQVIADEKYLLSVGEINLKPDITYICCPRGLGDTLYVAALVKKYKEVHSEIKKICFIIKENHRGIVSLFPEIDEVIISNEMVASLYNYSLEKGIWRKHNYIYGHFTDDWLKKYDLGFYEGNMVSFYKKFIMHLPQECELESPRFPNIYISTGDINKRTVVLMPYAESSEMLPQLFWERMGKRLLEMGYEVYTNVRDDSEGAIAGTKRISETVDVMAQFCEKSLAVISVRSGICDLLALTNTVLLIINTEEIHLKHWNVKSAVGRNGIFNLNFFMDRNLNHLESNIFQIIENI